MITSAELAKLTALSMDEVNQDIEELKRMTFIFPMKKIHLHGMRIQNVETVQAIVKSLES